MTGWRLYTLMFPCFAAGWAAGGLAEYLTDNVWFGVAVLLTAMLIINMIADIVSLWK